ncbi:protein-glutamine gamma-glutamyltransferase K-like [Protopterus annectens]|uniref:protein-glutamine gamma-glutamyltransferase K-like n=1 Tax=Protopterus annectens TaxID=7888 RepID=UPI001CFB8D96|nr:protein-glutamine gamma-glutamyltransferase K-like [Protopterus annectens]
MLSVKSINFLKKPNEANRLSHHTEKYVTEDLPVRRGNNFQIKIECNLSFDVKTDHFQLEFVHESKNPALKTERPIVVYIKEQLDKKNWGAMVVGSSGNYVTLSVYSPPNAPIGKFILRVKSKRSPGDFSTYSDPKTHICILFNPWCPDDTVFMNNEQWRQEYVLNEFGIIYRGSVNQNSSMKWSYAQFAKSIMDACYYTVDRAGLTLSERKDPVVVARKMSAMVNALDDEGILVGNWSSDYSGGTPPTLWIGSEAILLQYYKTGRPVRYAQCWVFAAVVTTILRSLGILCRTITNFPSAHDTEKNLTIDVYLDEEFKPLSEMNNDSIWNFHVWNEIWICRPDLPAGFNEWQAIDATPQEKSDGIYCCGPAPVKAIKEGKIDILYDSDFICSEVNIDKVYKQKQKNGTFSSVYVERNVAGIKILTKAVGSNGTQDLTNQYKYPKDSKEGMSAIASATHRLVQPRPATESTIPNSVEITACTDGTTDIGSPISFHVKLHNKSQEQYTGILHIHASMMQYNGAIQDPFRIDENKEVVLEASQETDIEMAIEYEEYRDYLTEQACMMFTVGGQVLETRQPLVLQSTLSLRKPGLVIKTVGVVAVGKESKAEFIFKNNFPFCLTDVLIRIAGPGLFLPIVLNVGTIGEESNSVTGYTFIPTQAGPRKLLASLHSNELTDVTGSVDIDVVP